MAKAKGSASCSSLMIVGPRSTAALITPAMVAMIVATSMTASLLGQCLEGDHSGLRRREGRDGAEGRVVDDERPGHCQRSASPLVGKLELDHDTAPGANVGQALHRSGFAQWPVVIRDSRGQSNAVRCLDIV